MPALWKPHATTATPVDAVTVTAADAARYVRDCDDDRSPELKTA
jgi:hypothetical protein